MQTRPNSTFPPTQAERQEARDAMQRDLIREQSQRKMEETMERKVKAVYCDTVCGAQGEGRLM